MPGRRSRAGEVRRTLAEQHGKAVAPARDAPGRSASMLNIFHLFLQLPAANRGMRRCSARAAIELALARRKSVMGNWTELPDASRPSLHIFMPRRRQMLSNARIRRRQMLSNARIGRLRARPSVPVQRTAPVLNLAASCAGACPRCMLLPRPGLDGCCCFYDFHATATNLHRLLAS